MNGYDYRHAYAVETTTLNVVYKDWHQSTYLNDTHGISSVCAYRIKKKNLVLTLSVLNLTLSPSSTTSRELLPQFSTCSGWRWLEVGDKLKKITMYS